MTDNLITDTFRELSSYIPKLVNGINLCTYSFRNGDVNKGLAQLNDILNGIDWALGAAVLTTPFHNIPIDMQTINNTLGILLNAVENRDYILTSDMLEYEIEPVFTAFIDTVKNNFGDTYEQ